MPCLPSGCLPAFSVLRDLVTEGSTEAHQVLPFRAPEGNSVVYIWPF